MAMWGRVVKYSSQHQQRRCRKHLRLPPLPHSASSLFSSSSGPIPTGWPQRFTSSRGRRGTSASGRRTARLTEEATRRLRLPVYVLTNKMSTMAWCPLPQSGGGTPSAAADEFFDDESILGWSLWSFGLSADDDHHNHGGAARAEKHGNDKDAAGSSDEHVEGPAVPPPPQQRTQPTDNIFTSQFSDEEMRRMDGAPFEALDMFPGSMHQLLSYENMLSGVLTGSSSEDQQQQEQDAGLGVDTMDTCGFPLFSHDLMQNSPPEVALPDLVTPKDHQDGASSVTKRSRSFEALVLQELEDEVFKMTKRTRVCYRDAFFRLAESSRAKCSAANGTPSSSSSSSSQTGVQQAAAAEGTASRMSTAGCPERETNAIDRTVADLAMKPPRPVPLEVLVSRCAAADDSGAAEAQSSATTSTTCTTTA